MTEEIGQPPAGSSASRLCILFLTIIVLSAGWFLFSRGMQRDLNHDEHQFLAPGVLLSREGLLPYRDYPLFHMPNLVFAYAALDRLTHSPLAAAKLLSVLASTGVIALLAYWIGRQRGLSTLNRVAVCLAGAILFLCDPLVLFTSGKTWNHEVPTVLIVAAVILQSATFSRPSAGVLFCAGLLSSLAAGSRLTFGPMLVPLLGLACIAGTTGRERLTFGLYWCAGAFIGFLPSLWLFLLSPKNFLFGNLEFPRLPLSDPTNLRVQKTIRWSAKFRFFFKEVARQSWPLFVAFAAFGIPPAWKWLRDRSGTALGGFVLLLLPFALFGCFAPSRYQYQHFFVISALMVVGVVAGLPFAARRKEAVTVACGFVIVTSGVAFFSKKKAKDSYRIIQPPLREWFAFQEHDQSSDLHNFPIQGLVLTLAPTWVLQADLEIYPEFATGPFAWRSAGLMAPERRKVTHMVAPGDLTEFLRARPPGAIFTGVESDDLEKPLVEYAKTHGFTEAKCSRQRTVWLPAPSATTGVAAQ